MIYLVLILITVIFWTFTRLYLRGENLSRYDLTESYDTFSSEASEQHFEIVELVKELVKDGSQGSSKQRLNTMRANMDAAGDNVDLTGVHITPANAAGVPGEWVVADGADPDRRFLYLHGGAFTMGSPKSHRAITSKLSKISAAAVLVVDYRLMPEHRRLDTLTDCQIAYRWILENGPSGPAPLQSLFVAGDSAGGNLSLAVAAWARDERLRAADAVVALSPATDATLSSPSIISNLDSDHMLAPMLRPVTKLPSVIILWVSWFLARVRPCDPRVSPAHGSLAGLPPTLVQCSEHEVLLDDARRYVTKAKQAGSEATLETWHHMVHVWHIFEDTLPEASIAFERIATFLEKHAPQNVESNTTD